MKNQKIITLALILLIIAGLIVVCLKGFNVDFMLKQHDSIEYKIDENFDIKDIETIAKEVFGDKKFKIRIIELFDDQISINAETITKDEADLLITKLNEKYNHSEKDSEEISEESVEQTENQEDAIESNEEAENDYTIISNPKIKLSSLFKPYIIGILISTILIIIYTVLRFKALNSIEVVVKLIGLVILTVLSLLSILAIVRFPINTFVIPVIMLIVLFEISIFFAKKEKELEE